MAKSDTDLAASFMQVLVMSEGEKWIREQILNISHEFSHKGKPVLTAGAVVRSLAAQSLKKAHLIASLED